MQDWLGQRKCKGDCKGFVKKIEREKPRFGTTDGIVKSSSMPLAAREPAKFQRFAPSSNLRIRAVLKTCGTNSALLRHKYTSSDISLDKLL